jgi:hypothetical protein
MTGGVIVVLGSVGRNVGCRDDGRISLYSWFLLTGET